MRLLRSNLAVDQKQRALRHTYVRRIPDRVRMLMSLWARWRHTPSDWQAVRDMQRITHNLAHKGGEYQVHDIAAEAAETTEALEALQDLSQPRRERFAAVETRLHRLSDLAQALEAGPALHLVEPPTSIPELPTTPLPTQVILLERMASLRIRLSIALRAAGFVVTESDSPRLALRRLRSMQPNLVFVGDQGPDQSPHDVVRYLSRDERMVDVPIVCYAMSATSESNAEIAASEPTENRVYWVRKPAPLDSLLETVHLADASQKRTHRGAHVTVLIVDPLAPARRRLSQELAAQGWHVLEADNGREALRQIRQHHPSLVVMDTRMPEIGGLDLCAHVRRDPELSDTAIVFLTANQTAEDVRRALKMGAKDYLLKPMPPKQIVKRLQPWVRAA